MVAMDSFSNELFIKAFEEIREPLFRYLFMLLGDVAEAEDLTQECFLRLNQQLRANKLVDNTRAWLFRTGHNLSIDYHRHRLAMTDGRLERSVSSLPDPGYSSPDLLLQRERVALIRTAMSKLSTQQRTCLRLRSEGLRYSEIAQILGVTEGTVCEHIKRGLARLKMELIRNEL
jgi:RNA polymerase sigma-70 factor (ECF subfamily)